MSANFQKLQALHRARQDKVNSRMVAVDKAEPDFQERIAQTQVWFGEARQELRVAQDQLDERKREHLLKQADIERAQEAAKEQAAKDEANRRQQQALLDTQEEELVAREQALAATLHGKDEEIEKLVAQRTQELERKHKDALDALALDQAGMVEKLELEREELEKEISKLTEDMDTANRTLVDLQVAVSDKTKLLSEASDSIDDLKLKLDTLEGTLSEVRAREETLNKAPEGERLLRQDAAAAHKDYVDSINLWTGRLIDVAERLTIQLALMDMPNFRYSQEANISPSDSLTLFFECVLDAPEQLRSSQETYLANEARKLCRGALTKVLTKVAFWYPSVDFANALESLPEDADLEALEERIEPIISCVDGVKRLEGQCQD
nr:paramyosin-like [Aegilops tauschii subsp. strangulata]